MLCLYITTISSALTLISKHFLYFSAEFMRSVSLSCVRMLTPQSCTTDPGLNAHSYFSDLSLIKVS